MYFITEDNGLEARLARLEGELEAMRAEIEALKAAEKPTARDRREYMRDYMRRKRATATDGGTPGTSRDVADTAPPNA
jgi:hypothetical protein